MYKWMDIYLSILRQWQCRCLHLFQSPRLTFSYEKRTFSMWWIISSWFSCCKQAKLCSRNAASFHWLKKESPDHTQIIWEMSKSTYESQTTCTWYITSIIYTSQEIYPAQYMVERSCGATLSVTLHSWTDTDVLRGSRTFPLIFQIDKIRVHCLVACDTTQHQDSKLAVKCISLF